MSIFDYQLQRSSRRKTLAVVIRRGEVKVMAPDFVPVHVIDEFVAARQGWIESKLNLQQGTVDREAQFAKQYIKGECFLLFERQLSLNVVSGAKSWVDLHGDELVLSLSSRITEAKRFDTSQKLVQNWYKKQMSQYLQLQLPALAQLIGVDYQRIVVRSYKRRWGSCTRSGVLSFNLLLAMAPRFVVDYVIIHELCHRVHMNHSADFWNLVSHHCKGYKNAKQWLVDNAEKIQL